MWWGAVLDRLNMLLGRPTGPNSHAGAITVAAVDPNEVAPTIGDFISRENFNDSKLMEGVRDLLMTHGFDGNGEVRDLTAVTEEAVDHLVGQLERMSNEVPNRPAARPPGDLAEASQLPGPDISGRNSYVLDRRLTSSTGMHLVYNRHMLVDRPEDTSDDQQRRMMDRIRHRLDPFASASGNRAEGGRKKHFFGVTVRDRGASGGDGIANSAPAPRQASLPTILMQLLTSSDLPSQMALVQLLLDARGAVPLVVPLDTGTRENAKFGHLAEALEFARVKLAQQEILSIAEDTELPRVVFVSNRKSSSMGETPHMASTVMNFQLSSKFFQGDTGNGFTFMEMGVGFLKVRESESQDHKPCLVFCVWGDHNLLGEVLAKFADFVIVEMEPSTAASSLSWITGQSEIPTLYWRIDPSDAGTTDGPYLTCWGSSQQIAEEIQEYLFQGIVEQKIFRGASEGRAATLKQCLCSMSPFNTETPVFQPANLDGIDLEQAKESLVLQINFNREADIYFESLRHKGEKTVYEARIGAVQTERKQLAQGINNLPLLQAFVAALSLPRYVERHIGIVKFEMSIEKKLHSILKTAGEKENQAFDEYQKNEDNPQLKENYRLARREHMGKKLGLEHLWRELSHLFMAKPWQNEFPRLAAGHLIDGFPLELLDGDASMFSSLWVDSILKELNVMLSASLKSKPKVFVLSVIGLQSSGKSTLLNVMFGTKLKTSAGQCTRGVYLQLIKSERKAFDYVLLLDTEGIRSPEFSREETSAVHDNRLATFAVLPADACIVLVANEDDNGLKEVLPMVMLAFKDSAMAEQCAGRRQAKVIFAYRSIDTNDRNKLIRNQRNLHDDLKGASKEVGSIPVGGTKSSSARPQSSNYVVTDTLLNDFRINPKDEEESDVKYFGNLKAGTVPPRDTPDWDYGTKVKRLREYIYKRVTDDGGWKAYELKNWATHLKNTWECITDANFEMSFKNRMEYHYYHSLQAELQACRQTVGRKWVEKLEELAGSLQAARGSASGSNESRQLSFNKLKLAVKETVEASGQKVEEILKEPKWQKWEMDELATWKEFISGQERDFQRRLQEHIAGVSEFDDVVKDYNAKIEMEIVAKTRNDDVMYMKSPDREKNMNMEFDKIFRSFILQAQKEHPPMAPTVRLKVTKIYQNSKISGQRFDFADQGHRIDLNPDKNVFEKWLGILGPKDIKQDLAGALESKVEVLLQDINQYADHLVDFMRQTTEESMKLEKVTKQVQVQIHYHVKEVLTEKLEAIQTAWDKNHNVSKRLEEEEERLRLYFKNCANRVDGTKMLFTQILTVLTPKLRTESFATHLAHHVSNKLINDASWAANWIVMRAHLDLHLVRLIETRGTKELLICLRNGAIHYKKVVDKLIEKEVTRQVEDGSRWKSFIEAIKNAVSGVPNAPPKPGSTKFSEFVQRLVQSINDSGPGYLELTRNLSNYLSDGVYSRYGDDLDFDKLKENVCQELERIKGEQTPSIDSENVVKLVIERMNLCATDNVGPRCLQECPHCRLTCFNRANHSGHHDTLHQPAGLGGTRVIESGELVPRSCSESVELDGSFTNPNAGIHTLTPFRDWNKHYTNWKTPTKVGMGTLHVREYIFANYQEEIARYYGLKICTSVPPAFAVHDIRVLKYELESVVDA